MTHPNKKLFLLQKYFTITWDTCGDHVKISFECRSNQVWKLTTCLSPSWYLSRLRFGPPDVFLFARKVIEKLAWNLQCKHPFPSSNYCVPRVASWRKVLKWSPFAPRSSNLSFLWKIFLDQAGKNSDSVGFKDQLHLKLIFQFHTNGSIPSERPQATH